MRGNSEIKSNYGFRKRQDEEFPPMVFAEITNVCNLNCIHCPYSYISKQKFYKPKHMDFDVYKRIVDEVSLYKGAILRLVCDGEPMTHPDFLKMIYYAKQKGIYPLCFNTNGTLLNKEISLDILKNNVDVVEISLDAIHKNTYEQIRKGANFEKVMSNVHTFIELRNQLKVGTKIMVSIIDQPEARDEVDEFIDYWTSKVDRVIKRTYTTIGNLMDDRKLKFAETKKRWPCPLLWTRIFINVDGLIKFCVEDWFDKTSFFDIRTRSIGEAWNALEYNRLREYHLSGRFEKILYCKECVDWPARKWDYDYFYALKKIL